MKRWLRFTAAVLAAAFLFALTGCGSSTNSASFTWFVDSIPANLDPQVASGASDVIACENLYGTLVRKDPDGELVPGLCEKWTVSSDGLTYTFTLKDGLTYAAAKGAATEYDITAEDFVFAFRRIFHAETASPYAVEFSAIQNSAAVLAGLADESSLGVSANGPLTLVFRLSERDDNFLAKLAMPGAAPCDEAFFESTRGTYGLTAQTTLASGSFYLYNWTASGLFLRRTVESPLVGSLRLVQDTSGSGKSAAQLIADDKCSAALDESGETTSLQTVSYSDTTWALLFNAAEGSVFQNQQLRQALAGIARENADVPSSGLYAAAKGLVPEGLTVDGLDYRETAGDPLPTIPEPKALYLAARQGMATSDFSGVTLLLPKNAGAYGGEMKDVLEAVSYLTADGRWVDREASELDFSYRHSAFEENGACILGAVFHLEKGDPDAIKARMNELMQKRIDKQPLDKPSAGSTFKRPAGAFAAALIDQCGLRGYSHGGAAVSDKHCGFVVNLGGATCADVLALCDEVRAIVKEKTGYDLEKEIRVVK